MVKLPIKMIFNWKCGVENFGDGKGLNRNSTPVGNIGIWVVCLGAESPLTITACLLKFKYFGPIRALVGGETWVVDQSSQCLNLLSSTNESGEVRLAAHWVRIGPALPLGKMNWPPKAADFSVSGKAIKLLADLVLLLKKIKSCQEGIEPLVEFSVSRTKITWLLLGYMDVPSLKEWAPFTALAQAAQCLRLALD